VSDMNFWERVKNGRFVRVLVVYLAASWIILQLAATLNDLFELPAWVGPLTLALLSVGLVIVLATAWVQAHPLTDRREDADEVPGSWEVDVKEFGSALSSGRMPHLTWGRAVLGGVFAFSLLFGFAGLYVVIQDRGQSFAPDQAVAEPTDPGIAFLPFEVSGTQRANLREGMVTLLDTSLDGVAGVRAIDDRTVLALWEQRVAPGTRADLATSLDVAAATGARYTLVGSVVDLGDQIRMSGEIYELPGGTSLGRVQAEGRPDSLAAIIEDLAIETLRTLGRSGAGGVPQVNLAGVTTHSLQALEAYLEGESLFRTADFAGALPHFEEALEADSAFALAHYRISQVIGWTTGAGNPDIQTHYEAALAGNLPPRMALLARAGQFQSLEPLEELETVVQQHPEDAEAWFTLGDLLVHAGVLEVDEALDKAGEAFSHAVELDPSFAPYLIHPIDFAFLDYDPIRAEQLVDAYGEASPGSAADRTHHILYELVFEPPADSTVFDAALDSLVELDMMPRAMALLAQPRASDIGEAYHLKIAEETGQLPASLCWGYALAEGRWNKFISYATDERLARLGRLNCLFSAYFRDYPVPPELLEEAAAWAGEGNGADYVWTGAYAASVGRWDEYDAALAAIEDLESAVAEGDSSKPKPDFYRTLRSMLEGFGAYARGEPETALEIFESLPHSYRWPPVRWWMGRLYLELGQPEAAARYFQSFFVQWAPWTRSLFYLGQAYEQMGDLDKAQEAYAEFLDIGQNAEPELNPMIEEVNLRLEAVLAKQG
jgi:tetratricopeptide (TPR) repeat protein